MKTYSIADTKYEFKWANFRVEIRYFDGRMAHSNQVKLFWTLDALSYKNTANIILISENFLVLSIRIFNTTKLS